MMKYEKSFQPETFRKLECGTVQVSYQWSFVSAEYIKICRGSKTASLNLFPRHYSSRSNYSSFVFISANEFFSPTQSNTSSLHQTKKSVLIIKKIMFSHLVFIFSSSWKYCPTLSFLTVNYDRKAAMLMYFFSFPCWFELLSFSWCRLVLQSLLCYTEQIQCWGESKSGEICYNIYS